jgi:hypothetical protein
MTQNHQSLGVFVAARYTMDHLGMDASLREQGGLSKSLPAHEKETAAALARPRLHESAKLTRFTSSW